MQPRLPRLIATTAVATLVLASCGADDGASSTTSADGGERGLRPPVAVEVGAVGTGSGAETAATDRLAADAPMVGDDAAELSIMPWFGGFVFEPGEGLPPLPTNDTGYEFPADATVDAGVVAEIAAALGVEGEVVPGGGRDVDGVLWRVGPDDGSAPTVAVFDDGQLNWYFSPAWPQPDEVTTEPAAEPGTPDEPVEFVEPEPPVNVPDAAAAEQRARDLLTAMGRSVDGFDFEVYADEWYASVNAWPRRDDVRWPMTWGFGFGEDGALQWAGGSLAEPVPAGPYPLVDLDTAIERLNEQGAPWGGIAVDATSDVARAAEPGEPVLDAAEAPADLADQDAPDTLVDPLPVEPVEPGEPVEPEVAVLVDVRAELWWVWDADGSVWLLPAYAFTDTEGRVHTVPAVTDEFVTFADPAVIEPGIEPVDPMPTEPVDPVVVDPEPGEGAGGGESGETGDMEPTPEPVEPVELSLDDLDRDALVGATVAEATDLLEADGNILRVVRLDGEDLAATMDLRPNRVNVAVEDDVVVELLSIG